MAIPQNTKNQIIESLIKIKDLFGNYSDSIVEFLNFIWPLREMPSKDDRFQNAYDDARQHLVNNKDWSLEFIFYERFNLLNGQEQFFIKFLETVVSPAVRGSKERITQYAGMINSLLTNSNEQLNISDYFENLPVYRLRERGSGNLPPDIIPNNIRFFITKYPENTITHAGSFTLDYDEWDDYSVVTRFHLSFIHDNGGRASIGKVKIMARDANKTYDVIDKEFKQLPRHYCSLGQSVEYYQELKNLFPASYQSVLLALQDVAIFPKIREEFENESIFSTSLARENITEQLMRTIRFELLGMELSSVFKFGYKYITPSGEESVNIRFDFEYGTEMEHRVYALIGKNGTGKTRLLSSIAKDLSERQASKFFPGIPQYAKVFSISYSFFDHHDIPEPDPSFNYVYCGLKKSDNTWLSNEELRKRFFESVAIIQTRLLVHEWMSILGQFVPIDFLDSLFESVTDRYGNDVSFKSDLFDVHQLKLSSGQSILLYILTEIVAQIRLDSLILYDEPETHLHPNAISELMNTLFHLVEKFKSFCIIGTHSPLIIQEMHARDVYIFERSNEANITSVRTLEQESFGENLSIITDEIFGNRSISRNYIDKLTFMVEEGKSYDEIVKLLQPDTEIPLNLNVKLYIKSLIAERR